MFEFAWLWSFLFLPLPLLFRLLPQVKNQQMAALKAPILHFHQLPQHQQSGKKSIFKLLTISLIWLLLVISAARPQWLGEPVSMPTEGRDLMLAVDLSGSMQIEDMHVQGQQVNRLVMIKHVMQDFIQRREGDRLGLILFADTAYLQTPLTFDRNTTNQMLTEAVIGLVGDKTAIGDAIGLAAKRFDQKEQSNQILILLTDGQNTSGALEPMQALELAKQQGIKIYTIGVGADEMLVQGFFGFSKQNPSRDLDENMLTKLATETGGRYFRARDANELEQIYQELDKLEPVSDESLQMRPLTALFYWPLAIALVLSVLLAIQPGLSSLLNRGRL
ncbi:VWA domain-containing protein [Catenovulum sp. 2E275]|uniref:vWA domain-containing protein n=1 Tax=Catenovulum sp. 2E275 TaxID=2980497 RepID=UPI0021D35246|nr:VWA domain-containing protein [Catenovulum sp. 2E275]MCU4676878.1 VWA domain-containing protein [Catenovulum sp. 2E275]